MTKTEAGKAGREKQLGLGPGEPSPGRTAEKTATAIGTSAAKVKKARAVLDHAPEEVKEAAMKKEENSR